MVFAVCSDLLLFSGGLPAQEGTGYMVNRSTIHSRLVETMTVTIFCRCRPMRPAYSCKMRSNKQCRPPTEWWNQTSNAIHTEGVNNGDTDLKEGTNLQLDCKPRLERRTGGESTYSHSRSSISSQVGFVIFTASLLDYLFLSIRLSCVDLC